MHYVIIGNSAAGINAAESIRRQDKTGQITIISSENIPAPYSRCLLSYYLAGEIPRNRLFIRDARWYRELNITPALGQRVTGVNHRKNLIVLDNRKSIKYDRLLIATGGSPFFLPVKGYDAEGVFGIRTLADIDRLNIKSAQSAKSPADSGTSTVVIGAGFIGLKIACALQKRGLKVTIVEKLGRLMPRMIDKKASGIFEKELKKRGIGLVFGKGIREIVTETKTGYPNNAATGVRLENDKIIPGRIIIMSVGVKPNIDFLKKSGIKTNQGIIVNEHLQANITDIFAAGDVTETIDFLSGQRVVNALWPCAGAQGKIAGYNMSNPPKMKRYQGSMAMNSVEFFGLPVISFGNVNPTGKDYKIIIDFKPAEKFYRKLVLKENRLVGLILVGKIEQAGMYLALLKRQDKITDFRL